jgi:hypothetical protein
VSFNIRSSMTTAYIDCPRRAAASQWRKIITNMGYTLKPSKASIGAIVGISAHAASKAMMDHKLETGTDDVGPIEQNIEVGIVTLKKGMDTEIVFDDTTESQNTAEKQVAQLVRIFQFLIAPDIKPVYTEKYRNAAVADDVTFDGSCDGQETTGVIPDYKFGSKYRPCHAQLGGYSILKKTEDGKSATGLTQYHIPRTSLKKPAPDPSIIDYDVNVCERAAFAMINHIARDMRAFLKTQNPWAFPANPMSMMCSEKYCPAYKTNFCDIV